MPSPSLVRDWVHQSVSIGYSDIGGTQGRFQGRILYHLKNLLTSSALGSRKWTVVASCNGTVFGNADYWTSESSVVFGGTGVARSWITLKSPDALGPIYMAIEYTGSLTMQSLVMFSTGTPSGGSLTASSSFSGGTSWGYYAGQAQTNWRFDGGFSSLTKMDTYPWNREATLSVDEYGGFYWSTRRGDGAENAYDIASYGSFLAVVKPTASEPVTVADTNLYPNVVTIKGPMQAISSGDNVLFPKQTALYVSDMNAGHIHYRGRMAAIPTMGFVKTPSTYTGYANLSKTPERRDPNNSVLPQPIPLFWYWSDYADVYFGGYLPDAFFITDLTAASWPTTFSSSTQRTHRLHATWYMPDGQLVSGVADELRVPPDSDDKTFKPAAQAVILSRKPRGLKKQ